MKYDFTSVMDRHGKDAIAVDALGTEMGSAPGLPKEGFDPIPMWVADMNFQTVPTIPEAIYNRACKTSGVWVFCANKRVLPVNYPLAAEPEWRGRAGAGMHWV